MGRSVDYPSNAAVVCYRDVSDFEDEWDFREWVTDLVCTAQARWPSFEECDTWIGRELHAVAENRHAYLVVAEYCGLASVSLVSKAFGYGSTDTPELAEAWCLQIADGFEKAFGEYRKIATASNGEAFYRRIEA